MSGEVTATELGALLADLLPIGRDGQPASDSDADGDGARATTRLAWSAEDERAGEWFRARADALGRSALRDPAGNLWCPPSVPQPWWAVGSHLDTVLAGGSYDGALGVAAGFALAARQPVVVIAFADEEGARFNTPTFGSRALAGRLDLADLLARTDAGGQTLAQALRGAGLDPGRVGQTASWRSRLRGLLELHIDQTLDVARAGAPAAIVSRLAARMRLQATLRGRADHAGTTRRPERHDALLAAARLIVAGDELCQADGEMVFTAGRIEVEPNAASTVPACVRLWLDARAAEPQRAQAWQQRLLPAADAIAREQRVEIDIRTASWSPGTSFSREVLAALSGAAALADGSHMAGELVCWAGHDAGVLAEDLPTGMVLVRNPTGVSHSPEEDVSLQDAAVAANVLLGALELLA